MPKILKGTLLMKIKKIFAGIAAAFAAVSLMATSVSAYDISVNKDFKTTWTDSTTISSSEFADLTTDSVVTLYYTADASLADVEGQDYWVIKPMINDAGWPFIAGLNQLTLSESGDSYELDTAKTQASFTVPAESVERLQTAGMALMGHGVVLEKIVISNDANINDVLAAENPVVEETTAADEAATEETTAAEETAAEETTAAAEEPATETPEPDSVTESEKTGNAGVAVSVCVLALAASAAVIAKKNS